MEIHIVDEMKLGEYTVIVLEKEKPHYKRFTIDNKEYESVTVFDARFCIAVIGADGFVGKTVVFE